MFKYLQNQLIISIPKENLDFFLSFFDLMEGYSFYSENIDFSDFNRLNDCFGTSSLFQSISPKVPFPQTLVESLQFIFQLYSEFLEAHYSQSLSLIIQNFNLISFDDFKRLPNSYLLKIFSSESLQIEDEDYLFEMVVQLINEDKNRFVLLQNVHIEFVSSHLLKSFFENISNDEIDFELFESFKKRIFLDYSDQSRFEKRWRTKPKVLSQHEISEIFEILNSNFDEMNNPIDHIKLLIEQNKQLRAEIEELTNPFLQVKAISHQNNVNGILQDLTKAKSNPVSFSSLSVNSNTQKPENFLKYDNSCFVSQDQSNQWLSVKFNNK
jgi:hypothetical protein